jgi:hypothetical protein
VAVATESQRYAQAGMLIVTREDLLGTSVINIYDVS